MNYEGASAVGGDRAVILNSAKLIFGWRYPDDTEPADPTEAKNTE